MTRKSDSSSRIARHLTLRNAELAAFAGSTLAVVLTYVVVGSGLATEANPLSAWLIGTVGLEAWALGVPVGVALAFAGLRYLSTEWPRFARRFGWGAAGLLVLDGVGNLAAVVATGTWPDGISAEYALPLVGVVAAAAILSARPGLPSPSPPTVRTAATVAIVLFVVLAPTAPFMGFSSGFSGVQTASAASSSSDYVYAMAGNDLMRVNSSGINWTYTQTNTIHGLAVGPDGYVYTLNDQKIASYYENGTRRWTRSLSDANTAHVLSVSEDGIFVEYKDVDGNFNFLKAYRSNGTNVNSNQFTGEDTLDSAILPNGSIVLVGMVGQIKIFDTDTTLESTLTYGSENLRTVSTGPNGTLYVGDGGATLTKMYPNGTKIWDKATGGNMLLAVSLFDDRVYSGENGGGSTADAHMYHYKVDGTDGKTTAPATSKINSLSSNANALYMGTENENIKRLYKNGTVKWSVSTDAGVEAVAAPQTSTSATSGQTVSGKVLDQNGEPVENATVLVTGSTKSTVEKAKQNLTELSDAIPDEFDSQLNEDMNLLGDEWENTENHYVGVYSTEDIGAKPWVDSADLKDPKWRRVPRDEDLALVIGNPEGCGPIQSSNEYNRQIPGCTVNSGTVILERISPSGEVTDTLRFDLNKQAGGGFADPSDMDYAKIPAGTLAPGTYRVTAEVDGERSSFSYLIRVGSPYELINQYRETVNDTLTSQASEVASAVTSGNVVTKRVTTNSTGHFSTSVPVGVSAVQVQAIRAPGVDKDPADLTLDNISAAYSGEDPAKAAVYMPSHVKRTEVPATDITLRMTELSMPAHGGNLSALSGVIAELRDKLENLSRAGEVPVMLENAADETRAELESTYAALRDLVESNPAIRERYLELSSRDSVAKAEDLTRSELETEITVMSTAIRATESTPPESAETSVGDDTVSVSWETEVPDDGVVEVFVDYSNGTTERVPDEYVTVNKRPGMADVVSVENYPLGSDDPAQAAFRLTVSGGDKLVEDTQPVTNPTFDGKVPSVSALDFSTLRPGPSEEVTVTVRGGSELKGVTDATAYAPDGTAINTSVNGSKITFTTTGEGTYKLRYTVENYDGDTFTTATTVTAAEADRDVPPTARAREGMLGSYLAVGSGLEDGNVDVEGDTTVYTVQIADDADVPNRVHVHSEDLTASTPNVIVRVVEGDSQRSVGEHVLIKYHTDRLDADTLVWRDRGDDEAITRDGSTKWGEVSTSSNGSTIISYTDGDGSMPLSVETNPSILDRVDHNLDQTTAGLNLPFVGVVPLERAVAAGVTVLAPLGGLLAVLVGVLL